MPIGPFSTDYLEVNPGPAISGSTANLFAQEGERIRKKIEEDSAKAEAQAKGPILAALYTDAYTKISQGDMSGFEKLSQAQLESATNPFLAAMSHDAAIQAAKLASDYTDKQISELRFKQQSQREDKTLGRQEKMAVFRENQDIRQRNAEKKSQYDRLIQAGVKVSPPTYEKEVSIQADGGLFSIEGDLPTASPGQTGIPSGDTRVPEGGGVQNGVFVNDRRIKEPMAYGGYLVDISTPAQGRPEQTIGGIKVEKDTAQEEADALADKLEVFDKTQNNLAKITASLAASGQKFHIVPIGKATDGQQKIELYIGDKPLTETITTKDGNKITKTDVPQQIPAEMFDLFIGKGDKSKIENRGIVDLFASLGRRGEVEILKKPGLSGQELSDAEDDARQRAKANPALIPQLNIGLKRAGSSVVLEPENPDLESTPEDIQKGKVSTETKEALKKEGVDVDEINRQQEESAKKIKEDYAKKQVAQKAKDRVSLAEAEIEESPKQIAALKKQKDKLVGEIKGMVSRHENIDQATSEIEKLNEAIKKLEERIKKARAELKDVRAIKE